MDSKASWRKYMTLVPDNSSVGSGAETILSGGTLKRRRISDKDEDEKKNAGQKVYAYDLSRSIKMDMLTVTARKRTCLSHHCYSCRRKSED